MAAEVIVSSRTLSEKKGVTLSPPPPATKGVSEADKKKISIWWAMMNFFVNGVMQQNQEEMSAAAYQVQVQNHNLELAQDAYKKIEDDIHGAISGKELNWFGKGVYGIRKFFGSKDSEGETLSQFEKNNPNSESWVYSKDKQMNPGEAQLQQAKILGVNTISTRANNGLSTTMQMHVQQPSQLNTQYAQQFSSMIGYFANMMQTRA